jgi:hypothetical protein
VLRTAGRRDEAIDAAERGAELFDQKANAASATRARAFAADVRLAATTAGAR